MEQPTIQMRVQEGMKLLDKEYPNWDKQFTEEHLENLDIDSSYRCVLAVLYGSYYEAKCKLGLAFGETTPLGFVSYDHAESGDLTQEWKQQIIARKEASN